jgi:hypothetical protein
MGTLKPGAKYIYEHVDDKVYAREFGADINERKIIGYTLKVDDDAYYKNIARNYFLEVEWAEILKAAETNSVLQDALDRVKILYHLSKDDG